MSHIFNADRVAGDSAEESRRPAPAPFLTDSNAVDTHNRLGGLVNMTDSIIDTQVSFST